MNRSTKKWIFIKISSFALLPLMVWFIFNFAMIASNEPGEIIELLASQPGKFIFSVFLVVAFFFFSLTISEIFEDYVSSEKIKNVAKKSLFIFAIVFSLLFIINVYRL